jgi:hypothetical protein
MGYDAGMDVRKATASAPPAGEDDWTDEPIGEAEWAAMPDSLRASIVEAEAAIDRGEWIDGDIVIAELRAMAARHRARAKLK